MRNLLENRGRRFHKNLKYVKIIHLYSLKPTWKQGVLEIILELLDANN